jgi:hypothetical protein
MMTLNFALLRNHPPAASGADAVARKTGGHVSNMDERAVGGLGDKNLASICAGKEFAQSYRRHHLADVSRLTSPNAMQIRSLSYKPIPIEAESDSNISPRRPAGEYAGDLDRNLVERRDFLSI